MITTIRRHKCDFCDNVFETTETEGYVEKLKCVVRNCESKPLPSKKWLHIAGKTVCDKHVVRVDDKVVEVVNDD